MEGFTVKAKDQLKLDIIYKIKTGKMTRAEGMVLLNKSESTIKRYIKSYREKGIGFLRHGNCLRKPVNKLAEPLKRKVQELVKDKYYDFNMLHAMEKIKQDVDVDVSRERHLVA